MRPIKLVMSAFGSYGGVNQVDGIAKVSAVQTYVDHALTWTVI